MLDQTKSSKGQCQMFSISSTDGGTRESSRSTKLKEKPEKPTPVSTITRGTGYKYSIPQGGSQRIFLQVFLRPTGKTCPLLSALLIHILPLSALLIITILSLCKEKYTAKKKSYLGKLLEIKRSGLRVSFLPMKYMGLYFFSSQALPIPSFPSLLWSLTTFST